MSKITFPLVLTAAVMSAAITAPALAAGTPAKVVGHPAAWLAPSVGANGTVAVLFRTDRPLQRRPSGAIAGGVRLNGHVASLSAVGPHARHCYVAYVKSPAARAGHRAVTRIYVTKGDSPHYDRQITIGKAAGPPRSC
jgi:hypothetical protein